VANQFCRNVPPAAARSLQAWYPAAIDALADFTFPGNPAAYPLALGGARAETNEGLCGPLAVAALGDGRNRTLATIPAGRTPSMDDAANPRKRSQLVPNRRHALVRSPAYAGLLARRGDARRLQAPFTSLSDRTPGERVRRRERMREAARKRVVALIRFHQHGSR